MPEVTDPNILAQLGGGQSAPAQSAPQFPGVIKGAPIPAPTPSIPSGYEPDGKGGLRPIQGGPADQNAKPETPLTESQGKAAGLLTRAIHANDLFESTGGTGQSAAGAGPRSLPGELVARSAPTLKNMTDSPERQKAVTAQRDFISAILRVESGAAVSQSEFDNYAKLFFPQPGDSPEVLKAKAQERRNAMEALRVQAGSEGDKIQIPGMPQSGDQQDGLTGTTTDTSPLKVTVSDATVSPYDPGGPLNPKQPPPSPFVASIGDITQAGGDMLGIVGNPLNAGINAIAGTNLSTDLGETLRTDILGIPHGNPTMEAINRFGTAALSGSMLARGAATLANPGTVKNVLSIVGKTPMRDTFAGMGAGLGGDLGKRSGVPGGELAGNIVGGLAGYGGASSVNALANVAKNGTRPTAMAAAANRIGVDMLPADAGGPVTKALTTGAKASPLSVSPIAKAARRAQDQMAEGVNRAARSQGDIVTTDRAGQSVRKAAESYSKETSARGARMYDKAFERAKGVNIVPKGAITALDEQIARVKENPAASPSTLEELTTLRDKISGGVSIRGLRDARTELSQSTYNGKLRSTADKQRYKDTLDAIAGDIYNGLVAAGKKDAAAMFKRADNFWRGRVEHIDEVLQPILGNNGTKSGEDIVKSIETMARGGQGGNARLSRLLSNMPEGEAGQVRATIIDRMGKANPGAQTAEGDAFSASTFLTNWNKMTPQAKASLFADKGLRQNMNDLATLADGMKASQAMANHSNTGLALVSNVGAQSALAVSHPVAIALGAGAQYLTGRLLASPAFARLLARTAKMPADQAARTISQQVGVVAGREPLLANDLTRFMRALNDNAGHAAVASDGKEQQQQQ